MNRKKSKGNKLDPAYAGIEMKVTPALRRKLRQEEAQRRHDNEVHQRGYDLGFTQGSHKAKQAAERRACSDLCESWSQTAQHAQAAANYALAISEMFKSRVGAQTVAQTTQRRQDDSA